MSGEQQEGSRKRLRHLARCRHVYFLHQDGKSVREIAKLMDRDTRTVANWLRVGERFADAKEAK